MTVPALELSNVTRTFRQGEVEVHALRGLDLVIQSGEFTAIVGPSGSGKTTALNLAGALDVPSSGTVRVAGVDIGTLSRPERAALRRDRIGFVFQSYNLIPVLTAEENAASVLALQGRPEGEQQARVAELFQALGLTEHAKRRPDQLSGGQQQRVAVARAVAPRPAVVLADEPTANLDAESALRLLDLMRRLNDEHGITFVFSTHDDRVVERARRVVTMVDGRVAEDVRRAG